jgi:hypothetical protein
MSYWYNWLSWWWAHGCWKHVENWNKHIRKKIVCQVGYLQGLYRDARSAEHKTWQQIVVYTNWTLLSWRIWAYPRALIFERIHFCLSNSFVFTKMLLFEGKIWGNEKQCTRRTRYNLTFRHRASCILGQAFHYAPENAVYIFKQQIYFIIWCLLDRASLHSRCCRPVAGNIVGAL